MYHDRLVRLLLARARPLFAAKGVAFTDIDVVPGQGGRAEMLQRSGRTSVPQIFIGATPCGRLRRPERAGRPRRTASFLWLTPRAS